MNKILLSLAACLCLLNETVVGLPGPQSSPVVSFAAPGNPQGGHSIRLQLKPYTEGKVYLGYYYGKIKALADSAELNASGEAVFSGK
ncbi:MAG: hypothetical protein JST42_26860, partial [Bacteroidetes bacterium]|nr:hypothetical protein [Bacteroidota bacterium]